MPLLPTIKIGKHDVTRMICGENPFYGYAHFNRLLGELMREWYTDDRIHEVLSNAVAQGINTWEFTLSPRSLANLERARSAGLKLNFILLSSREMEKDLSLIPKIAKLGPIAMVHHGGVTDQRVRAGEQAKIRDFLKRVRDVGVLAGMSTHNPKNVERAEEEGWETDLYMTCCYQLTRTPAEIRAITGEIPLPASEVYLEGDPGRMLAVVRKTPKPCLAFKILAAGRRIATPEEVDRAFRFAFDNIKPTDAVIVGTYPRFRDEVKENAARVRALTQTVSLLNG
jgi:hypothetical protein